MPALFFVKRGGHIGRRFLHYRRSKAQQRPG
nr:MAG TPA: hypothetical protein [Caudoviricetes sp.]